MTKETIDTKYKEQASALEAEYFDVMDAGKLSQHRTLKQGKVLDNFKLAHGLIWKKHNTELLAEGLIEPRPEPEPVRDLASELDLLKARVESLELK